MNTPTPTPRTDAATYPADCLGKTLVTNRDCARALETELVTLTGAYTCTHHNDAERTACPVCLVSALTAERDELRDEAASQRLHGGLIFQLTAERDQLRAEVERSDAIYQRACEVEQELRSELAIERERVRVLREALENLRDEQNGAPLCTREEEWKQAMDKADAALAATEESK